MKTLRKGFCWVVGNENDIQATTDHWIQDKKDFHVENSHVYECMSELVSTYFSVKFQTVKHFYD